MTTNIQTLTPAELAERAAKAMGWIRGAAGPHDSPECKRWVKPNGYATRYYCHDYSPATDDAQAAELMRFAVAKCGADAFAEQLLAVIADGPWATTTLSVNAGIATADARARTIAAVAVLEGKSDA